MDYLKKHYEKLVLFVVLFGLAASAFWLTNQVGAIRTTLEEQLRTATGGKQKSLPRADLTNASVALARIGGNYQVVLDGEHKTFNPARWIKSGDGYRRQSDKAVAVVVGKVGPLNLNLTYTGVAGTPENIRYQFTVEKAYEKLPAKQRPLTVSLTEGTKNETFMLREVKGAKESATEVVVELVDGGAKVELVRDKTFSKVFGYAADLKVENSNREYPKRRQDDSVNVNGTSYKIISITPEEVIFEAPNKTRTSLKPAATP